MPDNFLEIPNVIEANRVNLDDYVFLDSLSGKRGTYCFKVRQRKQVKDK